MRIDIFFTLCLASAVSATLFPRRKAFAMKEMHNPPSIWKKVEGNVADQMIRLYIGLKSPNFHKLEDYLSKSSDPSNELYGAHLSAYEVNELVAPSEEALDSVQGWLAENGIHANQLEYSPAKDWIFVYVPIRKVEKMLNTKYSIYEHTGSGERLVRAPHWSLPQYLHDHIEVIQPTNSFFRPKSSVKHVDAKPFGFQATTESKDATVSSVCTPTFVSSKCLRTLYGTIDYRVQASDKNSMGINNFLGEVNNRSDNALYLLEQRPEAVAAAYSFETKVINGGNNYQGQENASRLAAGSDTEGNLDSETMIGIAWPTKLTTFNTGGMPPFKPDKMEPTNGNEPYLEWLNAVLGEQELPYVISSSYGDDEQTVPYSYAKKVCDGFAQLGARGITLFFASGDNGVGQSGTCTTNDGKNTPTFLASFPPTCPYVTVVGGTRDFKPERVAFDERNGYVSGGGFSRYFPRPSYQAKAVAAYVKSLGDLYKGLYNPNGRGYPDVAAQGYSYAVVWNGTTISVDGTSAATPCFAAVTALVNDDRLAAGQPSLGFLNPFIYARGFAALNDVTLGSAVGCDTPGFPAAEGWDAVTGFGTPDFKKLVVSARQAMEKDEGLQSD